MKSRNLVILLIIGIVLLFCLVSCFKSCGSGSKEVHYCWSCGRQTNYTYTTRGWQCYSCTK